MQCDAVPALVTREEMTHKDPALYNDDSHAPVLCILLAKSFIGFVLLVRQSRTVPLEVGLCLLVQARGLEPGANLTLHSSCGLPSNPATLRRPRCQSGKSSMLLTVSNGGVEVAHENLRCRKSHGDEHHDHQHIPHRPESTHAAQASH